MRVPSSGQMARWYAAPHHQLGRAAVIPAPGQRYTATLYPPLVHAILRQRLLLPVRGGSFGGQGARHLKL